MIAAAAMIVSSRPHSTTRMIEGFVVESITDKDFRAVDVDHLNAERLFLVWQTIAELGLIEDSKVCIETRLDISPILDREPVCNSTCHLADRVRHCIARAAEGELEELRETVIDRRVLDSMILYPCIRHI